MGGKSQPAAALTAGATRANRWDPADHRSLVSMNRDAMRSDGPGGRSSV
jgi:hypothetical protein